MYGDEANVLSNGEINISTRIPVHKTFDSTDKWLDLGGDLFANLKVNKKWTITVNENGEEYELFGISYLSFYDIDFLYRFLNDMRWAWFNSVRETDKYKNAIKWAEEKIKAEQKA